MSNIVIGTAAGNKSLAAAYVGTASGNKAILSVYAGTASGNKLIWSNLSASASPTSLSASATVTSSPTTGTTTATPSGGIGPFTYAWSVTVTSGNPITITAPTSATTAFRAEVDPVNTSTFGNATCVVTDTATGLTATTNAVGLNFQYIV